MKGGITNTYTPDEMQRPIVERFDQVEIQFGADAIEGVVFEVWIYKDGRAVQPKGHRPGQRKTPLAQGSVAALAINDETVIYDDRLAPRFIPGLDIADAIGQERHERRRAISGVVAMNRNANVNVYGLRDLSDLTSASLIPWYQFRAVTVTKMLGVTWTYWCRFFETGGFRALPAPPNGLVVSIYNGDVSGTLDAVYQITEVIEP
jgi:hypothetical protein